MPAGPAARLTGALAGVLLGDFSLDAAGAAAGNLDVVLVFSIVVFTSSPDSGLERDAASACFSCSSRFWGAESCGASAFLGGTSVFCVGGGEGEWLGEVGPLPGFLVSRELKKLASTPSAGGGVLAAPLTSPSSTL